MLDKIPTDKLLHFLTGGYLFLILALIIPAPFAMVAVVIVGIGKEVYDHFHREVHTPEALDAVSTAFGGCFAWALLWAYTV